MAGVLMSQIEVHPGPRNARPSSAPLSEGREGGLGSALRKALIWRPTTSSLARALRG